VVDAHSLCFIGDAIYSLKVRTFYIEQGYHGSKRLQELCKHYVSAQGQRRVYERLMNINFLNETEQEIFKKGRNCIKRVPKHCDLETYGIASGVEALCGYLWLEDKERCELLFSEIFKGGIENE